MEKQPKDFFGNILKIGDIIQLSFTNDIFGHTLIVTSLDNNEIRIRNDIRNIKYKK